MIPLNYHHLYYFWTVARAGSIAGAAERLLLSQPTLSGQLKELEQFCHTTLFERGKRGVTLTREGQAVFEYCERIFPPGEELAAMLESGFSSPARLNLGFQSTLPREALLLLLDYTKRIDRDVRVSVFSGEAGELVSRLQKRTLDVAVTSADLSAALGREFWGKLAATLPVGFFAAPSLARKIHSFPAGLNGLPILLRPPRNPVRQQVEAWLSRRRVTPTIEAEVDDLELIRRMAVEGRGVATMNLLAARRDTESGRLRRLNRAGTGISERIWLLANRTPRSNPALQRLLDALLDSFEIKA